MREASESIARPAAARAVAAQVLAARAEPGGMSEGPWAGRRLHFVGIGGAGMSGLAIVAAQLGATVSGSDRAESSYLERVRAAGAEPVIGHDAGAVPEGEDVEVVYSTAVPEDNPERAAARSRGLRELHRSELLGEVGGAAPLPWR